MKHYKERHISQYCHQVLVYGKHNPGPYPVINSFPEKDNPFWKQKKVPGNSTYSEVVQNDKKNFMIAMTKVRDIRKNKKFYNSFVKLRSFSGATLKHLKYYFVPPLIDKTPDRIIFYGRCYNPNEKNPAPEIIANERGECGNTMSLLRRE